MRIRPLALTLAAAALLLAGRPAAAEDDPNRWSSILADFFMGPQVTETFHWKGAVATGKTVEIKDVNGSVTVQRGAALEVTAVKRGRRNPPSAVTIATVEHEGGVTICAVYPTTDGIPNECRPGSGGRMNVRNNDVGVAFTVTVPDGVNVVARTVNGAVTATGLTAGVEARTVNGSITLDTRGAGQAETVNGSIEAKVGANPAALRFKTVNGAIRLTVPADTNARLKVQTVNGRINTSLRLRDASFTRRTLVGTLGNGGPEIDVQTVNGSVDMRGL